jgi:hypothetical protein
LQNKQSWGSLVRGSAGNNQRWASPPWTAIRRTLENSPANDAHMLTDPSLSIEVMLLDVKGNVLARLYFKYQRGEDINTVSLIHVPNTGKPK